jgi:hypothetical protein
MRQPSQSLSPSCSLLVRPPRKNDDGVLPVIFLPDDVVIATSLFSRLATLNNQLVELEELADDRLSLWNTRISIYPHTSLALPAVAEDVCACSSTPVEAAHSSSADTVQYAQDIPSASVAP